MSLQTTLESIRNSLASHAWQPLNEAQTIQVVVLRLLGELGWDIWNPREVWPQKNSGGGSGGYVPDFILNIDDVPKVILEAKALDTRFADNEFGQAINYATNHRLRWTILTDGRSWYFFDKNLIALGRAPSECLRLTLDLLDPSSEQYFRRVLSRDIWLDNDAEVKVDQEAEKIQAEIRGRQSLENIKEKLRAALSEGYAQTNKGIRKAIENELEPNEQEIAFANIEYLESELIGAIPVNSNNQDTINMLKQCISKIKLGRNSGVEAWVQGDPLPIVNWGDLLLGCVETYIVLSREKELHALLQNLPGDGIIDKSQEKENITYRTLSDGRLLYVNLDANDSQKILNELSKGLGFQKRQIEVKYKGVRYIFPRD